MRKTRSDGRWPVMIAKRYFCCDAGNLSCLAKLLAAKLAFRSYNELIVIPGLKSPESARGILEEPKDCHVRGSAVHRTEYF